MFLSRPVLQPSRLCPCNRIATDAPGLAIQMGHRARWRSFPEFEVPLHHLPGAPRSRHGGHGGGPAANARPVMRGDQIHLWRGPPGGAVRHRASDARGGATQQLLEGQAAAGETALGRHGRSKTKNREAPVVRWWWEMCWGFRGCYALLDMLALRLCGILCCEVCDQVDIKSALCLNLPMSGTPKMLRRNPSSWVCFDGTELTGANWRWIWLDTIGTS